MKKPHYQILFLCMLAFFSILSFSACQADDIDIDIATDEVVGTWSDSKVQSATGSTRYISVTINKDGSGDFYFESLAYTRVAGFTWTFKSNILTCTGIQVETTSDGEVNTNQNWICTFEYTGSALIPQKSPYKDFILTQSGNSSDTNGSEEEDTDPNFECAVGIHYMATSGNTHLIPLAWSVPSGMRSKGLTVFGIAIRCKNGKIINENGSEDGLHIKSVGSYKYFHASVQDNKTDYGAIMYVTCSDPELEFEFYPLYTLNKEEIEGVKRSKTVTVSNNNGSNDGNDDDDNNDDNDNNNDIDGSTANCYIISEPGSYKFKTVKGNSSTSVGPVSKAEVLWESFGTSTEPSVGDLIKSVRYEDGYILFETADKFKEGNAVIAAKSSGGLILWSWHIWLTDEPKGQVYYNNAGTMMDRNLGATSATPGDVGALGLLYQWGRKDPFLGSSSISGADETKSTGTWPSAIHTSSTKGTIDYVTENPMTFITADINSSRYDWHYSSRNDNLWKSSKTIYDPCPAGWRVPSGGNKGVWPTACGLDSSFFRYDYLYDYTNNGMNFAGKFGNAYIIWYPAFISRDCHDGNLGHNSNFYGFYWSVTTDEELALALFFSSYTAKFEYCGSGRADGNAIRCQKE